MSYTVEHINGCTKKFVFNFESVDLTGEVESAVKDKQKDVALKGFRKGKAPLSLVNQIYGPQIQQEALSRFISGKFFDAVQSEGFRAVGYPSFENTKFEEGKNVSFDATIEVFPQVEVTDYNGYSFEQEDTSVSEEEEKQNLDRMLGQKAETKEIEDESVALANGHTAVMNFEGVKEDGERPENMKGEEFLLEIGSGRFIPGFEEGMLGMKKGEKKDVKVTFPEDYHEASLQKAPVTFEVELLEIKQKVLPDLNDELAKELGYESVEDLKTKNKKALEHQKTRTSNEKLHQDILDKLVKENSFDVPNALLVQQKDAVRKDLEQTLRMQGMPETAFGEYFEKWDKDVTEKAEFQVRSGLILDKLATDLKIETADSDLDAKFEEMAQGSGMPAADIKKFYLKDDNQKRNLTYAIREEKTFEALKKNFKITTKKPSKD